MTTIKDKINMEWTDDIPEADGMYLVTFLAKWTSWNGEEKEFRGIDLVECSVDENYKVTWYTDKIAKRFPGSTVEIVVWMYLPEVFE